ncbi:hypothetical protein C4D60_Mb05t09790 [Musa balbisiana]|uniref:Uncharacterized protein n=1 Tax=Musa balbisiana TaxID=52838 RepID=A0A4S8JUX7_MUSBA|nr:hypothetical protein C4D60_Mb05t09790 [Musa balbisiana]
MRRFTRRNEEKAGRRGEARSVAPPATAMLLTCRSWPTVPNDRSSSAERKWGETNVGRRVELKECLLPGGVWIGIGLHMVTFQS